MDLVSEDGMGSDECDELDDSCKSSSSEEDEYFPAKQNKKNKNKNLQKFRKNLN